MSRSLIRRPHRRPPTSRLRRHPTAALALLLAASVGVVGACSDEPASDGPETTRVVADTGADAGADAASDTSLDAPADAADTGGDEPVEPPTCSGPVCYAPLAAEDYPEAQDPPRHALHCNEHGLISGCPSGTRCGGARQLPDGRRVPVCEASSDLSDVVLDFSAASSLGRSEDTVRVDLTLQTAGQPFPARDATLLPNNPWTSRIVLTHRESGAQWVEPLPAEPAEGFRLHLPRGVYDVLLITAETDFPTGGIPTTETRGILTVDGPGQGVIDAQMASLTLRLRYLDSTLTSAESAAMRVTLEGESGQTVAHQFTGQERGIAELALRSGSYELTIVSNGSLPSLFPNVPMVLPLEIEIPQTRDIVVDIAPELVEATLVVDGEPADGADGAGHTLLFETAGRTQSASISSSEPGTARALLWPSGTYDVWYSNGRGAMAKVGDDWSPRSGTPLEVSVDTELVAFELDLSDQLGAQQPYANLTLRHAQAAAFANFWWLDYVAPDDDGVFRWEAELVPGEPYDVGINANVAPFPQGRWQIADDLRVGATNVLDVEIVELDIALSFRDYDGDTLPTDGAQLYLEGADPNVQSVYVSLGGGSETPFRAYRGTASAYVWPTWDRERRIPYQRYDIGRVELEEGAHLVGSTRLHRLRGELRYEGEPYVSGPGGDLQYSYLQIFSPSIGSNSFSFNGGDADFDMTIGPGLYRLDLFCGGERCAERGIGVNVVPLVEALSLPR